MTLIQGHNGSGKSSLIEALYYACYLRPLRTHIPREIIRHGQHHFFIGITGTSMLDWQLNIGFAENKRVIKINEAVVKSYKELVDTYCLISAIDDDMLLIKGSPEHRRAFIDQALLIGDPMLVTTLRHYRRILEQRNAMLGTAYTAEIYETWTEQFWQLAVKITQARNQLLVNLEQIMMQLASEFEIISRQQVVKLIYQDKLVLGSDFAEFLAKNHQLKSLENIHKRTAFGPHLDDIAIIWIDKQAKAYASRGQQKMLVFLLKIALYKLINKPAILALDDFTADLDEKRIEIVFNVLSSLNTQIILTSPLQSSFLTEKLKNNGQIITLG